MIDKEPASTITLSWGADRQVTGCAERAMQATMERNITLTQEQIAAHTYTFEGLKERTEYSISASGVESGNLVVTTLGQSNFWDFTDVVEMAECQLGFEPDHRSYPRFWPPRATFRPMLTTVRTTSTCAVNRPSREGEAPRNSRAVLGGGRGRVIAIDCYASGPAELTPMSMRWARLSGLSRSDYGQPRQGLHSCPGIPASAVVSI
ncbi:MAG: hypothetical protein ACLVK4_14595 [Alistipes shahii]|uniref:hypothetical protein n=1 Tax=Alistipes shahii TaxID=328814 RepID=UPI00399CC3AC